MDSKDLAQFSLAIGTAMAVFLGLAIAAATMCLASMESAAVRAQDAIMAVGKNATSLLIAQPDATEPLKATIPGWRNAVAELARQCTALKLLPGEVTFEDFEAKFLPASAEWNTLYKSFQEETSRYLNGLGPSPLSEMQVSTVSGFLEMTARLLDLDIARQAGENAIRAYKTSHAGWLLIRSDLRQSWVAAIATAVPFVVALASTISSPSIGEHELVNLTFALLLAVILGVGLTYTALRVRTIASHY